MEKVDLERVEKDLKYLPRYIREKLHEWVSDVEEYGIEQVRKRPGYHDEPLQGKGLVKDQLGFQEAIELFIGKKKMN